MKEWWRGAVVYQIYPRSFLDTSGDGTGDLPGIIQKLDYIANLGVDAVWLSPFFPSPMRDFGYDVANYCDVDPLFGSLEDFDALVSQAHALSLKIIIDQVYSHTSDQHEWFMTSKMSHDNEKSDWYVWADPQPDGTPPNNWQSVFGGPAWTWDNRRRQYYLHNFLSSQPDLNLHNEDVQDALLNVARFWLDRGVDGFRLDALNFGMHDETLRNNPPRQHFETEPTRPFDFQEHAYNLSHPELPVFLERLRSLLDQYQNERFTVAEIVGPEPLQEMKDYTKGSNRLSAGYSFDYLYADDLSADLVRNVSADWSDAGDSGWPAWAFSNHDAPRVNSRWGGENADAETAKLFAMLSLALRGTVFLYQGEELGLPQAEIPFDRLQDPEAIENWPETLGRDGARSPMPWTENDHYAGFSTVDPWLPIDMRHYALAVDLQQRDEKSVLSFVRDLIAFRKSSDALKTGSLVFLDTPDDVLAFTRGTDEGQVFCIFNLGRTQANLDLPLCTQTEIKFSNRSAKTSVLPETIPAMTGYWL
ncbi:alpha-amylase family glycosyl hydrolase [Parvularcula sp. IMCC14364]|uniref:alpha-amylase family glycosyl hydrolase n=1 Tax=Parvularcula sp. IMCC14364 TaxID=3067902 RepID=UPI002740C310|nr:alpha-amylase family glycosyl hydrolase [Parvularcula sp. IMCC14364]